jgi:hypothetical protein
MPIEPAYMTEDSRYWSFSNRRILRFTFTVAAPLDIIPAWSVHYQLPGERRIMAITPAFQAGDVGSIPIARSLFHRHTFKAIHNFSTF